MIIRGRIVLTGGQLEEWTKLGYQALCGYDGFNDRYADKIFDQQYLKKTVYPQHMR